jgi:hypothetical protein
LSMSKPQHYAVAFLYERGEIGANSEKFQFADIFSISPIRWPIHAKKIYLLSIYGSWSLG